MHVAAGDPGGAPLSSASSMAWRSDVMLLVRLDDPVQAAPEADAVVA